MGWQDAPEVTNGPAWTAAPVIGGEQPTAAKETGFGEAAMIGAGRMGSELYEQAKKGVLGSGAILAQLLPERLKARLDDVVTQKLLEQEKARADRTKEYEKLAKERPVATALGEAAPLAAMPVLRMFEAPGALAAAGNMAASSAIPGAMLGNDRGEMLKNAAISGGAGAAGSALTSGAVKVLGGVKSALTPEAQRLAALAEDKFNIPLDAAQKSGSKFLQTVDAALENMPATSGAQATKKVAQRDAFTREVMKTLGEDTSEATQATLGAAKGRMGGEFERIFSKVHVSLDDTAIQTKMGKVLQEAIDTLPPAEAKIVANHAGDLLGKIDDNGAVAGKAYQAWRSKVQGQASKTKDEWLATKLRDLYRVVDEAAYNSAAQAGEDGALKTVRGQYRNMKVIEPLVAKSEDGVISPKLLRGEVMKHYPDFATGGGGDIGELAKIGRSFVSDQVPNSGTAQRMLAQSLITGGMGGGAYAATGDPMMAAKVAAGSVIFPKAFQMVANSRPAQRLITSGVNVSPEAEQGLASLARLLALSGATASER